MSTTKPVPVRIPQATIDAAKRLNLNIAEIMRSALEKAVGVKHCPACKQPIRKAP